MNLFGCNSRNNCIAIAVISSIIIGIIAAVLQITSVIAVTPAFLWVTFGISVVYLAIMLATASLIQRPTSCRGICCSALSTLLISILGTVLFSLVLLAVEFTAASIVGAIILGVLLFFFSLTITSTACFVKCLLNCNN